MKVTGSWIEVLRPCCERAGDAAPYTEDVVLFYLARWCQKETGDPAPALDEDERAGLEEASSKIVRNLAQDGPLVDRLVVEGDAGAWTDLRRALFASAYARVPGSAGEFADEALQKVALVLLTGTPPSRAAEQLMRGPEGPANEYIFLSPLGYWARTVVVNMIVDDQRREARRRARAEGRPAAHRTFADQAPLIAARDALGDLVEAIRTLPTVQRSVIVMSLHRRDLDEVLRERLHTLAPDLFSGDLVGPDRDIAERLGTTPRLVAANRSAARRKLAERDERWALLLDVLLPHRSTKPARPRHATGARGSGR